MNAKSLSATNLAVHHHRCCDLYIHNAYHQPSLGTLPGKPQSELLKAQLKRGLDWEATLYDWLDRSNLLLHVPSVPLETANLLENILADERDHMFITNITFWPPHNSLSKRFIKAGSEPIHFGLAKPDLLEITRLPNGIKWRVIDAKASKVVKTSHHVQIYFYRLCLSYILDGPLFYADGTAGVWLPPKEGFDHATPSKEDIKSIDISLLAPSLDQFLFHHLPRVLKLPYDEVKWHFNPLCKGCEFETHCRSRALDQGAIGSLPNISTEEAENLKEMLRISRFSKQVVQGNSVNDIEDLHTIISNPATMRSLDKSSPIIMKRVKRILALPRKLRSKTISESPVLEASRQRKVQVIPQRSFTCPAHEDVAIVISLLLDPSSPGASIEYFYITVHSQVPLQLLQAYSGHSNELISTLARLIRAILSVQSNGKFGLSSQFFVWSSAEQTALQTHLIHSALGTDSDDSDIRLCIGTLAQGASLLQTIYQPHLLSGALLTFLSKGRKTKMEYIAFSRRLGLQTSGTIEELRKQLELEVKRIQAAGKISTFRDERHKEFGQLPPIVVLKKEVEKLVALPTPGYWDLTECASVMLWPNADTCYSDDEIFSVFKRKNSEAEFQHKLVYRNRSIYAVLQNLRKRTSKGNYKLLVNEAKQLSPNFLDLCHEEVLRKLFFMQQFEVLTKLNDLWQSRINGCPDALIIEYQNAVPNSEGTEHVFRLISGTADSSTDSDHPLYNYLLVPDVQQDNDSEIPVEALFDDLSVSGLVFPLNRYTIAAWSAQHSTVLKNLVVADIRSLFVEGHNTLVTLRLWGSWETSLQAGDRCRLSPRLVDFNTTKVLSTLFEFDLRFTDGMGAEDGSNVVPFLQLIKEPRQFGKMPRSNEYLKVESGIQKLFRELKVLDNPTAGDLVLKPSQRRAAQRIISNRLSIIWGPPGTGKTHTIALALLRLLEAQHRLHDVKTKVAFITAVTHAAIDACKQKLQQLIQCYKAIDSLSKDWLDSIQVEEIARGSEHQMPADNVIHIYAGTIYQLYNFTKRHSIKVDCVVIDEAGQIALSLLGLVLRCLHSSGRIIIAGDSEQLAPILSAQYPKLKSQPIFGSILECLMPEEEQTLISGGSFSFDTDGDYASTSQNTIVQLTENFRLNPDLGEFVSTIYSRKFVSQKIQTHQLASALQLVKKDKGIYLGIEPSILDSVQTFLVSLSSVMLGKLQHVLVSPPIRARIPQRSEDSDSKKSNMNLTHQPVSLALIRLHTYSKRLEQPRYEMHLHGEAAVAAAIVASIQRCSPGDDIFVATPHRVQREAVRAAIARIKYPDRSFEDTVLVGGNPRMLPPRVTVDTIERLQGSEAAFVICLFSVHKSFSADVGFLLQRRRLNVAISRAKNLCILVTSNEVLCPSVRLLANEETVKGYAFLKAFEERAWSYKLNANLDFQV